MYITSINILFQEHSQNKWMVFIQKFCNYWVPNICSNQKTHTSKFKNSITDAKTPQPGGIRETQWNSKKFKCCHGSNPLWKFHENTWTAIQYKKAVMAMKCVVLPWQQWLGDSNQKLRNLRSSKCKAMLNFWWKSIDSFSF